MVKKEQIQDRLDKNKVKIDGELRDFSSSEKVTIICECGNKVIKSIGKIMDINRYICCKNCSNLKRINTTIDKYGVPNIRQSRTIDEKIRKTNIEKYGTEYPLKSNIIKEKIVNTNREKYGVDYGVQSNIVKQKIKKAFIDRFGVDNPRKNSDIVSKTKETNKLKYGYDIASKSDIVKKKIVNTNITKYGVEYGFQSPVVKEKIKNTFLERYNVDHNFKIQEVKDKIKETNISLYGTEYPMQNKDVMEKSIKKSYYKKKYRFPSGKEIDIQGYENMALDELISSNIFEDDITTNKDEIPTIWYEDKNGKRHRHYVDIYIKSLNKCIEVKSSWTYKINKETVLAKQDAAKKMGLLYEIWIYHNRHDKQVI